LSGYASVTTALASARCRDILIAGRVDRLLSSKSVNEIRRPSYWTRVPVSYPPSNVS
jgi:hypothetical protein